MWVLAKRHVYNNKVVYLKGGNSPEFYTSFVEEAKIFTDEEKLNMELDKGQFWFPPIKVRL